MDKIIRLDTGYEPEKKAPEISPEMQEKLNALIESCLWYLACLNSLIRRGEIG